MFLRAPGPTLDNVPRGYGAGLAACLPRLSAGRALTVPLGGLTTEGHVEAGAGGGRPW